MPPPSANSPGLAARDKVADAPTIAEQTPVGDAEFAELMAALDIAGPVAVAVSGGGDSMALSLLVARWAADRAEGARYITFDHGLRDGSRDEALRVGQWLAARGLEHTVLTWHSDDKPTSNIQESARLARYEALENWCAKHGIKTLLVAHHLEDQAETFLLRLARGSGVDGLAAMQPRSSSLVLDAGPDIVRPFLQVPKARLLATLRAMKQDWIEDPLNRDEVFTRVQARRLLADAPMEGLNAERLAATAGRMGRVRRVLDGLTEALLRRAVQSYAGGYARLDLAEFSAAEEEIALRALSRVLVHYSGASFPPRLGPLERLFQDLKTNAFGGATLSGCQIIVIDGQVYLGREEAAIGPNVAVAPGDRQRWDHRYWISHDQHDAPLDVAKLGKDDWAELVDSYPEVAALDIPVAFRPCLAAGRVAGRLVFVGDTGFARDGFGSDACIFRPRRQLFG